MIVCVHCGQEVFWGFPRPDDPCIECGKPIAVPEQPVMQADADEFGTGLGEIDAGGE